MEGKHPPPLVMVDVPAPAHREEPQRLVAADHPDRLWAAPSTLTAVFFKVDPTDDLPIHACIATAGTVRIVARFLLPGDAALAYCRDTNTLPAEIVLQWNTLTSAHSADGRAAAPSEAREPARLRKGTGAGGGA